MVAVLFSSKSQCQTGWRGKGRGRVDVSSPGPGVLLFREAGTWEQDGGKEIRFTNTFRWTLVEDRVRLEHLRYGDDKPVFCLKWRSIPKAPGVKLPRIPAATIAIGPHSRLETDRYS